MPPRPKTNLAPVRATFFGREDDLDRLHRLFSAGDRLVTLLGPAGIGKTRLAARYGERHRDEYERTGGGVWFCDVTEARDLGGVIAAVAHALDIPTTVGQSAEDAIALLARRLDASGPTLLLFDNCEQVVAGAAALIDELQRRVAGLVVLATSRDALKLAGERVYELAPLALPAEGSAPLESAAVRLFVDRAQSAHAGYVMSDADAPRVVELVRRLDGLPLAIELAAARTGVISVSEMLDRLSRRFDVLASGPRGVSERHRTLRGAIDWSWDLLGPRERAATMQCAVFRGGFTLEAAEAVIEIDADERAPAILDVLQSLHEKSLLRAYDPAPFGGALGEVRIGMYESIREYAAEKLRDSGDEAKAHRRHRSYFVGAALRWSRGTSGLEAAHHRRTLGIELENILVAHERALSAIGTDTRAADDALGALAALGDVYTTRGPFAVFIEKLDATLADEIVAKADPALTATCLNHRGYAYAVAGRADVAKVDLDRSLAIARQSRDQVLEVRAHQSLGVLARTTDRLDDAIEHHRVAVRVAREMGEPLNQRILGLALGDLAVDQSEGGRLEEARASFAQAIALLRGAGDVRGRAICLGHFAWLLVELGEHAEARRCCEEGIDILRVMDDRRFLGWQLGALGMLDLAEGRNREAELHCGEALAVLRDVGDTQLETYYRAARAAGE